MENASYIALSRQTALQRQMDVVANNMANANTPGYKGEQMLFREYLTNTRSTERAMGGKVSFVQDVGLVRDTREGSLTKTDNTFDMALHGDGYFQIETQQGMRYSRNGHFRLDEGGMLVTSQGFAVMNDGNNPIILAPNESNVTVAPDGTVSTENGVVGRVKVVKFSSEQELRKSGDGMFETTQDPETVQRPSIMQGMMEESNVQPVVEMTKMTEILRQYQGVQKMIENENDRQIKAMTVLSAVKQA